MDGQYSNYDRWLTWSAFKPWKSDGADSVILALLRDSDEFDSRPYANSAMSDPYTRAPNMNL